MKTELLAQQFSYFKKTGHVRLEDYPIKFEKIRELQAESNTARDLWRTSPYLKKLILHGFGPIALELMKKTSLRLGCDQWVKATETTERFEEIFCFQGVATVFFLSKSGALDIYDGSHNASFEEEGYLVCFAFENAVLINNQKDLFCNQTKRLGYVLGDRLRSEFHPLVTLR